MADGPVRFGIIGCAEIARKVSRAISLAPNASLYALASRSADKAARFAADNGFPPSARIYGSYEALLDDPGVDAVYVPLPTSLHLRWAVAAARKGKHVLLEKPVALNVAELDQILAACDSSGVQFMDGTMWTHNPRTAKMSEFLSDAQLFGELKVMHVSLTTSASPDFLKNDIRVNRDLDALGALGDLGWYCARAILWAAHFDLPTTVVAIRGTVFHQSTGTILSCGASLHWPDGRVATFHCSFLANLTFDFTVVGTKGTLSLQDLVIPFEESSASFYSNSGAGFTGLSTGTDPKPSLHTVAVDMPQEARMVAEFARLVKSIKGKGVAPEKRWVVLSRKTQVVLDAVKESIEKGCEPVEVMY